MSAFLTPTTQQAAGKTKPDRTRCEPCPDNGPAPAAKPAQTSRP